MRINDLHQFVVYDIPVYFNSLFTSLTKHDYLMCSSNTVKKLLYVHVEEMIHNQKCALIFLSQTPSK